MAFFAFDPKQMIRTYGGEIWGNAIINARIPRHFSQVNKLMAKWSDDI
jgi:hypothetical protein